MMTDLKEQFCPDTEEKHCISYKCPAFKDEIDDVQCTICKKIFGRGYRCVCRREGLKPSIITHTLKNYCVKYKINIEREMKNG